MRRELIGYRKCLLWLANRYPLDGMCIQLIGDALSAVLVVAKGGSQQMDDNGNLPVLELVLDMYELMWECNAVLLFHWRPREFLTEEDSLSKVTERHDFSLHHSTLQHVWNTFGSCNIDVFAADHNSVCERFFTRFNSAASGGWDAFTQDWSGDRCFWLPPFAETFLSRVIEKIQRDQASGILVIPCWSRQVWVKRLFCQMKAWIKLNRTFPGSVLRPNNSECFFGKVFECQVLVLSIQPPC